MSYYTVTARIEMWAENEEQAERAVAEVLELGCKYDGFSLSVQEEA